MTEIPIPDPDERPTRRDEGGLLRRIQPLLTMLIAFTAIALTLWEGIENRRHNRLSVQPRLDGAFGASREGDTDFVRISVEGTGLGPAVIKAFRVYFDGQRQDTAAVAGSDQWRKAMAAANGMAVTTNTLGTGYYFPPGRQQVLFEARHSRTAAGGQQPLSALLDRIGVQICYCSVYGTGCDQVLLAVGPLQAAGCPH